MASRHTSSPRTCSTRSTRRFSAIPLSAWPSAAGCATAPDGIEPRVKAWLAWSSGKDSAWALHVLRSSPDVEVVGLLTTVNEVHDRVAMHGVRRSLLQAQAKALGLPLVLAPIPHPCSNEEYERVMAGAVRSAREEGVSVFAFGDLFLEDIRRYRETRLEGTGIRPLFPLWGRPTPALAEEMIAGGL